MKSILSNFSVHALPLITPDITLLSVEGEEKPSQHPAKITIFNQFRCAFTFTAGLTDAQNSIDTTRMQEMQFRDSTRNTYPSSDKKPIFPEKDLPFPQSCWDLTEMFPNAWCSNSFPLCVELCRFQLLHWSPKYNTMNKKLKKVGQMCSCCSNWAMTTIPFKTSSLGLPSVVFICTVPTIIFQPVEFLVRQHLQKLLHFWLYLLNMSSGKGNWLQGPREEFDTELVCTCSKMNSNLHSHRQTHSCTTSKPDRLPGPSSPKERVIKGMILSISHPLTCKGRKTLDRGRPLGHLLELLSASLLLMWHP